MLPMMVSTFRIPVTIVVGALSVIALALMVAFPVTVAVMSPETFATKFPATVKLQLACVVTSNCPYAGDG